MNGSEFTPSGLTADHFTAIIYLLIAMIGGLATVAAVTIPLLVKVKRQTVNSHKTNLRDDLDYNTKTTEGVHDRLTHIEKSIRLLADQTSGILNDMRDLRQSQRDADERMDTIEQTGGNHDRPRSNHPAARHPYRDDTGQRRPNGSRRDDREWNQRGQ